MPYSTGYSTKIRNTSTYGVIMSRPHTCHGVRRFFTGPADAAGRAVSRTTADSPNDGAAAAQPPVPSIGLTPGILSPPTGPTGVVAVDTRLMGFLHPFH